MTSVSEILGADIHGNNGDPTGSPVAYEAEITAVAGGLVSIVVPGYSTTHDFADLEYLAPAGTPSVGDAAIAVFTDARDPLVLVPGTPTLTGAAKFSQTIGDAAATSYDVDHNLNTRDVSVTVREEGTNYEVVGITWRAVTVNRVTVIFASAPALNSRRVTVIG